MITHSNWSATVARHSCTATQLWRQSETGTSCKSRATGNWRGCCATWRYVTFSLKKMLQFWDTFLRQLYWRQKHTSRSRELCFEPWRTSQRPPRLTMQIASHATQQTADTWRHVHTEQIECLDKSKRNRLDWHWLRNDMLQFDLSQT